MILIATSCYGKRFVPSSQAHQLSYSSTPARLYIGTSKYNARLLDQETAEALVANPTKQALNLTPSSSTPLEIMLVTTNHVPVHLVVRDDTTSSGGSQQLQAQGATFAVDPFCGPQEFLKQCREAASLLIPGNMDVSFNYSIVYDQHGVQIYDPISVRRGDTLVLRYKPRSYRPKPAPQPRLRRRPAPAVCGPHLAFASASAPACVPASAPSAPSTQTLSCPPAAPVSPPAPAPAPAVALGNLTPLELETYQGLSALGFSVSEQTLKRISKRCSSAEAGVIDYVLNMQEFEEMPASPSAPPAYRHEGAPPADKGIYGIPPPPYKDHGASKYVPVPPPVPVPIPPPLPPRPVVPLDNLTELERTVYNHFCIMSISLSHAQLVHLCKRASNPDSALDYYLANPKVYDNIPDEPVVAAVGGGGRGSSLFAPVQRECRICMDTFDVNDMCTMNCSASHRFCFPCIARTVVSAVKPDDAQPHIPACPLSNGADGCVHTMGEDEVRQVIEIASRGPDATVTPADRDAVLKGIAKLYVVRKNKDIGNNRAVIAETPLTNRSLHA